MSYKDKKLTIILAIEIAIIAAFAIAIIAAIGIFVFISGSDERELKKQLDLGHKYLAELDYEQAIASFKKVVEIDPVNEEAYLGMVDAYVGKDDLEAAKSVLEDAVNIFKENGLNSDDLQSKLDEIDAELERIEAERIEAEKKEAERKRFAEDVAFKDRMAGLPEQAYGALYSIIGFYHFDGYTWEQRKELCHPLIEKLLECIDYLEERNMDIVYLNTKPLTLEQAYDYCNLLYIRCNELDECYELRKRKAERFGTPDILKDGYCIKKDEDETKYFDKYGREIRGELGGSRHDYIYYMGNLKAKSIQRDSRGGADFEMEYDNEGRLIKETTRGDLNRVRMYTYDGNSVTEYKQDMSSNSSSVHVFTINEYGFVEWTHYIENGVIVTVDE